MEKDEFEYLRRLTNQEPLAKASEVLTNHQPRTLVFGYTLDRNTFHVYLAADGIHRVIYDHDNILLSHKSEANGLTLKECLPDKRAYPERCDFEFSKELAMRGLNLSFTTWTNQVPVADFYGMRLPSLVRNVSSQDFHVALKPEHVAWMFPNLSPEQVDALIAVNEFCSYWESTFTSYLKEVILRAAEKRDPTRWITNALELMPSYFPQRGQEGTFGEVGLIAAACAVDKDSFVQGCEKILEPVLQSLRTKWS